MEEPSSVRTTLSFGPVAVRILAVIVRGIGVRAVVMLCMVVIAVVMLGVSVLVVRRPVRAAQPGGGPGR